MVFPSMKGSRPPPCVGFSLTVTDEDQAVMFGGRTSLGRSFKACLLHLPTMMSSLFNTHTHCENNIKGKFQKIALYQDSPHWCEVGVA